MSITSICKVKVSYSKKKVSNDKPDEVLPYVFAYFDNYTTKPIEGSLIFIIISIPK